MILCVDIVVDCKSFLLRLKWFGFMIMLVENSNHMFSINFSSFRATFTLFPSRFAATPCLNIIRNWTFIMCINVAIMKKFVISTRCHCKNSLKTITYLRQQTKNILLKLKWNKFTENKSQTMTSCIWFWFIFLSFSIFRHLSQESDCHFLHLKCFDTPLMNLW